MSIKHEIPGWALYWGAIAAVMLTIWLGSSVYADVQTLKIQQAVFQSRQDTVISKLSRIEEFLMGTKK